MLVYSPNTNIFQIFKRLFLFNPTWSQVYQKGSTEQLLTHSSVPKEHPLSEQGAFLVPVPILKPAFKRFHLDSIQLCFNCEELRSSAVETRKHLRLISQKNRPNRTGRFFCAVSKWSDDISTSTSCFRVTAFKYSSGFNFQYPIQPLG